MAAVQNTVYTKKGLGWQDPAHSKEVRYARLGLIGCVSAAVIFGVLAGLFMWKGDVLSLGNRKLCAIGFSNGGVALIAAGFAAWLGYKTHQATKDLRKEGATSLEPHEIALDNRFSNLHDDIKTAVVRAIIEGDPQHFSRVDDQYLSLASQFSHEYLNYRLDQGGFTLQGQPENFQDAMVAHIVGGRHDHAALITDPSWIKCVPSDKFWTFYLPSNPDLGKMNNDVRDSVVAHIMGHQHCYASLITDPSWIKSVPSDAFWEFYLPTNPDLGKMHDDVRYSAVTHINEYKVSTHLVKDPSWTHGIEHLCEALMRQFAATDERYLTKLVDGLTKDKKLGEIAAQIAQEGFGSKVGQALIAKLTKEQVAKISENKEQVQMIANVLPKNTDYQMPEALKRLWSKNGGAFVEWFAGEEGRLSQKTLINDFTKNLGEPARAAANLRTKTMTGRNVVLKNDDNNDLYRAILEKYPNKSQAPQIFIDAGIYP